MCPGVIPADTYDSQYDSFPELEDSKSKIMKKFIAYLIVVVILFLLVVCLAGKRLDCEIQVSKKLKSMTIEEKLGQMIMVAERRWSDTPEDEGSFVNSTTLSKCQADAITKLGLCGVCLFGTNISDTEQTVKLTSQIQDAAFSSKAKIGAFISADQEGGYITRLTTGTSGIGNMALAATGEAENAYVEASIISEELSALGINVDFAPDSDVNSNPNNPVIGVRSFSDDPEVVSEYAGYFLNGLHEYNVAGCLKHFPGHGDTDTDSHTGFPVIDKSYEEISCTELVPFIGNADKADMIMTAHIQFPQIETSTYTSISTGKEVFLPATMSKTIISDILRDRIGYDGIVVTDALEMDAISKNFEILDAMQLIINADVDIILMPVDITSAEAYNNLKDYIAALADKVRSGEIEEDELDNSVERILTLKYKMGLLEEIPKDTAKQISKALKVVGSKDHHDAEWSMAMDAVTVYKNDNAFPLSDEEKSSILYLSATEGQVLSSDFAVLKLAENGFDTSGIGITSLSYAKLSFEDIDEKLYDASAVILTTSTGAAKQTDTSNPDNTSAILCEKIITRAHELGKKVIVISTNLPYDADFYSIADAVLMCYNPSGITALPEEYDGTVIKYGANLPSAIYNIIGR